RDWSSDVCSSDLSLSEELPIEFFGNRFRNWFYRSSIVVRNLIFASTTFKQRLGNTQLTVKLFSKVRNVFLKVVVDRSIKLVNLFSAVRVCNTIVTLR